MLPLVFEPYLRPMVWGGRRLGESFGKRLPDAGTYGESWEVSAHPLHVSRVAEGPHRGEELTAPPPRTRPTSTATASRPTAGSRSCSSCSTATSSSRSRCTPTTSAPALTNGREHFGKTEAWVVLEASPGAAFTRG